MHHVIKSLAHKLFRNDNKKNIQQILAWIWFGIFHEYFQPFQEIALQARTDTRRKRKQKKKDAIFIFGNSYLNQKNRTLAVPIIK